MFIQDPFWSSTRTYSHAIVHTHPGFKSDYKASRVSIGQGDQKVLTCLMLNDRWKSGENNAFKKHVAHTLAVKEDVSSAA